MSLSPELLYLAGGVVLLLVHIGLQAILNMLVALGLLPTKGLALPFVSYGRSALVVSLWATGMLLSISNGSGGFLLPQRTSR